MFDQNMVMFFFLDMPNFDDSWQQLFDRGFKIIYELNIFTEVKIDKN